MRFQRITQAATLIIFIALLTFAAHPYHEGLQTDFFLRLDPLVAVVTSVLTREVVWALVPGLLVAAATLVLGRFFCGHICPMGTSLDILEAVTLPRKKAGARDNSYEATSRFRSWKYWFLAAIFGAAVGGFSLLFLGSPLSLVTRFYGLVLYPLLLVAGDSTLQLASALPGISAIPGIDLLNLPTKVFATNFFVAALFLGIASLAFIQPRFWCRNLCPAGAVMAILGRSPVFKRHVDESCIHCGQCTRECPTAAISENPEKRLMVSASRARTAPRSAPYPPFLSLSAPLPDRISRCPCPTSPGGAWFSPWQGAFSLPVSYAPPSDTLWRLVVKARSRVPSSCVRPAQCPRPSFA